MKDWRRLWDHVLFWGLYWLVLSLYGGLYDLDFGTNALFMLFELPFTILLTYPFVYHILPLFFQQRWLAFGTASVLIFGAALIAKRLFMQYVEFPWLYADNGYTFLFLNWHKLAGYLVELVGSVGIVAGLKYYRDWKRTKGRVEALSAEKREAELSFLKAQVHPHFLFNTLNSIYYEVLRKSDGAPDLIIRLSDILRFTLYECKDPLIPIAREIKLIESYIALEKCRFGERLSVALSVTGDTEQLIPPLICFSLIENAFKHGTSQNKGHSHIEVLIGVTADHLRLEVQNPVIEVYQPDVLGATKGIGLQNTTQQLNLIFGDRYSLQNEVHGDRFLSILEIPLNGTLP